MRYELHRAKVHVTRPVAAVCRAGLSVRLPQLQPSAATLPPERRVRNDEQLAAMTQQTLAIEKAALSPASAQSSPTKRQLQWAKLAESS